MTVTEKENLIVSNGLVKIVGIFEFESTANKHIKKIKSEGYIQEIPTEEEKKIYKDYFYPEFRDVLFVKKEESSAKVFTKKINKEIQIIKRNSKETVIVEQVDLFIFPKNLNLFAIQIKPIKNKLSDYSNLTNVAREFYSEVLSGDKNIKWVNWIEENCLSGIKIASDSQSPKVEVDEYSGSKFKLFTLLDIEETISKEQTEELLYDIGCVAKIGSAGSNEDFSPSVDYYNSLLANKISVFKNYTILPLFDSFTVIGKDFLNADFKLVTWNKSYFRIILFNLYIKYSLFKYNAIVNVDSTKVRDDFEYFLNTYNLSHISYNFLPNLIYQHHRTSLETDLELDKFQKRINRISQSIQEEEQKRSNLLLSIVSVLASISSIQPIFDVLEKVRIEYSFNSTLYYTLISLLVLFAGLRLLIYLYPDKYKLFKRRWRKE
jgi:hypothetical protein